MELADGARGTTADSTRSRRFQPDVRREIHGNDSKRQCDLDRAGQVLGIKNREEIVADEVAARRGGPGLQPQPPFQRCQRANKSRSFDQHPPESGRQVHPAQPRPPWDKKAAADDEGDERQVKQDYNVGQ